MEHLFKIRKERLSIFKNFRPSMTKSSHGIFDCPSCSNNIQLKDIEDNLYICNKCNHYTKIPAYKRIEMICDSYSFKEYDKNLITDDLEHFPGYKDKLKKNQESSNLNEAVIWGKCKIDSQSCVIVVMDSLFMMGSMGRIVGEKITRAIEYATKKSLPIIIFCASGGARMQEGIISLMQMAKTSAALKKHSDNKNLYISVITNPTTGGVSASFAMLGDIIIAEPNAIIGFAGKRVIEKTINESLPDNFQTAEFVQEKGFIDLIVARKELKKTLIDLLKIHRRKH